MLVRRLADQTDPTAQTTNTNAASQRHLDGRIVLSLHLLHLQRRSLLRLQGCKHVLVCLSTVVTAVVTTTNDVRVSTVNTRGPKLRHIAEKT